MAKKKKTNLSKVPLEELEAELARRIAETIPENATMTDMEMAVEATLGHRGEPMIAAMLSRMKPEKPTAKRCPRCGRRVPVKALKRPRTVQSLAGSVTFERNYHYCGHCSLGFYPVDLDLGLPEEGELTSVLEKRVLDFAINDSYELGAQRWSEHYRFPISANLLRRVADRVGRRLEACHEAALAHELKEPPPKKPELVVVQNDGGMIPMRGEEPWREVKLGVIFQGEHHLSHRYGSRGMISQARYVGVLGPQEEFRESLDTALRMERALTAKIVVWIADGAKGNWRLASDLVPKSIQVLDWYHAVENAMACGRKLLGEESPWLPLWKERIEELLAAGDIETLLCELEACLFLTARNRRKALRELCQYYRNNQERMRYPEYLALGLPIGSGIVESGHRHVIQRRMKNAGQHWSESRGRRMVRMRAAYHTAGLGGLCRAIHRAEQLTRTGRIPKVGWQKRRASNYGTTGVRPKTGRHSRY
jgi:hypothetical protein